MKVSARSVHQLRDVRPIPVHDIDVEVPVAVGGEGDLVALRGPRGIDVVRRIVREVHEVGAVHAHEVDLVVPVTVGDEGDSAVLHERLCVRGVRRDGQEDERAQERGKHAIAHGEPHVKRKAAEL
jgi:hypothetical protein